MSLASDVTLRISALVSGTAGLTQLQGQLNSAAGAGHALGAALKVAMAGLAVELISQGAASLKSWADAANQASVATAMWSRNLERFKIDTGEANALITEMSDRFGVAVSDLQGAATLMIRSGADLELVRKAFLAAGSSAQAGGKDASLAIKGISEAIVTGRSELTEYAGIIVNSSDAYAAYAKSVGKATDELSQQEKMLAFTNAMYSESKYEILDGTAAVSGYGRATMENTRAQREFSTTMGQLVLPFQQRATEANTRLLTTLTNFARAVQETGGDLTKLAARYPELARVIETVGPILKSAGAAFQEGFALAKAAWERILKPTIDAITPYVQPVLVFLGRLLSVFFENTALAFRTIRTVIEGDWQGAWNGLQSHFTGMIPKLVRLGRDLWDQLVAGASEFKERLRAAVLEALANALQWIQDNVIPKWFGLGQSLIGNLIDGMRGRAEEARQVAADIAEDAARAAEARERRNNPEFGPTPGGSGASLPGASVVSAAMGGRNFTLNQEFGANPFKHGYGAAGHNGIDFKVPAGTQLYAGFTGYLEAAGFDKWLGNFVRIVDESGQKLVYAHLSEFSKEVKDALARGGRVVLQQGTLLGLSGSTGNSTGPHLHLGGYTADGRVVDPRTLTYRPAGSFVSAGANTPAPSSANLPEFGGPGTTGGSSGTPDTLSDKLKDRLESLKTDFLLTDKNRAQFEAGLKSLAAEASRAAKSMAPGDERNALGSIIEGINSELKSLQSGQTKPLSAFEQLEIRLDRLDSQYKRGKITLDAYLDGVKKLQGVADSRADAGGKDAGKYADLDVRLRAILKDPPKPDGVVTAFEQIQKSVDDLDSRYKRGKITLDAYLKGVRDVQAVTNRRADAGGVDASKYADLDVRLRDILKNPPKTDDPRLEGQKRIREEEERNATITALRAKTLDQLRRDEVRARREGDAELWGLIQAEYKRREAAEEAAERQRDQRAKDATKNRLDAERLLAEGKTTLARDAAQRTIDAYDLEVRKAGDDKKKLLAIEEKFGNDVAAARIAVLRATAEDERRRTRERYDEQITAARKNGQDTTALEAQRANALASIDETLARKEREVGTNRALARRNLQQQIAEDAKRAAEEAAREGERVASEQLALEERTQAARWRTVEATNNAIRLSFGTGEAGYEAALAFYGVKSFAELERVNADAARIVMGAYGDVIERRREIARENAEIAEAEQQALADIAAGVSNVSDSWERASTPARNLRDVQAEQNAEFERLMGILPKSVDEVEPFTQAVEALGRAGLLTNDQVRALLDTIKEFQDIDFTPSDLLPDNLQGRGVTGNPSAPDTAGVSDEMRQVLLDAFIGMDAETLGRELGTLMAQGLENSPLGLLIQEALDLKATADSLLPDNLAGRGLAPNATPGPNDANAARLTDEQKQAVAERLLGMTVEEVTAEFNAIRDAGLDGTDLANVYEDVIAGKVNVTPVLPDNLEGRGIQGTPTLAGNDANRGTLTQEQKEEIALNLLGMTPEELSGMLDELVTAGLEGSDLHGVVRDVYADMMTDLPDLSADLATHVDEGFKSTGRVLTDTKAAFLDLDAVIAQFGLMIADENGLEAFIAAANLSTDEVERLRRAWRDFTADAREAQQVSDVLAPFARRASELDLSLQDGSISMAEYADGLQKLRDEFAPLAQTLGPLGVAWLQAMDTALGRARSGVEQFTDAQEKLRVAQGNTQAPFASEIKGLQELAKKYPELKEEIDEIIRSYQELAEVQGQRQQVMAWIGLIEQTTGALAGLASAAGGVTILAANLQGLNKAVSLGKGIAEDVFRLVASGGADITAWGSLITRVVGSIADAIGGFRKAREEVRKLREDFDESLTFINGEDYGRFYTRSRGFLADFFAGGPEVVQEIDKIGLSYAKSVERGFVSGITSGLQEAIRQNDFGAFKTALKKSVGEGLLEGMVQVFMQEELLKNIIAPAIKAWSDALKTPDPRDDQLALDGLDRALAKADEYAQKFYDRVMPIARRYGLVENADGATNIKPDGTTANPSVMLSAPSLRDSDVKAYADAIPAHTAALWKSVETATLMTSAAATLDKAATVIYQAGQVMLQAAGQMTIAGPKRLEFGS